eukprot:1878205-Rhodomonas_salina.2
MIQDRRERMLSLEPLSVSSSRISSASSCSTHTQQPSQGSKLLWVEPPASQTRQRRSGPQRCMHNNTARACDRAR